MWTSRLSSRESVRSVGLLPLFILKITCFQIWIWISQLVQKTQEFLKLLTLKIGEFTYFPVFSGK